MLAPRNMHVMIAYIDPATGSLVLQVVAAGIISAGVALRHFKDRIKAFFRRGAPAISVGETPPAPADSPPTP
jgi:hypothetical protein